MSVAMDKMDELQGDRGVLVLKQTLGTDFLQSLFQYFKLTEIHESTNDIFKKAVADLLQTLQIWINIPEFRRLHLRLSGDQIFINDLRIRPKPRHIEKTRYLLSFMRKRRLIGFSIEKPTTAENLTQLLWGLARADKNTTAQLEEELANKGLIEFKLETLHWKQDAGSSEIQSLATDIYKQLYAFAKTCFEKFNEACEMKKTPLESIFDSLQLIDEADLISLLCLNTVNKPEKAIPGIAVNSAFMLYGWAKSLGLPSGVFQELAGAGLAHPLVMVNAMKGAPLDVKKFERSSLAMSNFERIKSAWPLTDLQILAVLEWSIPYGSKGVYEISGQKCYQHFFSRMLRIVVLFQQMISVGNASPEDAVAKLLSAEMGCDQTLVRLFVHWVGIYPVGSFVVLSSGETGQICSTGNDLLTAKRPTVSIYKDKDGNILSAPKMVDLNEAANDAFIETIQKCIPSAEAAIPPEKLALLTSMMSVSMSN